MESRRQAKDKHVLRAPNFRLLSSASGSRAMFRDIRPRQVPKSPSRNPHSGCYVPNCLLRNCKLRTHHQFPSLRLFDKSKLIDISTRSQNRADLRHKLIPLPSFSDPLVDDEEFKNLFHQYLTFDMPRIVATMAPPSSTETPEQSIRTRQQGIATLGSLEPVYFLLFVSMAHLLELIRREQLESDKISARLYGRLMQLLRDKLTDFKPSEGPNLVLSVLALSSFDMSLGNSAAVEGHRIALQHIVSQVGVPYLGRSMAYVLSWDRLIATYTGKPALFAKMPDRRLLRTPQHPKKYGAAFELYKDKLELDPDVYNLATDLCRAIEIVEAEDWTFRPERLHRPYSIANVQYLYFIRDVIQNTCVILQAKNLDNQERSKPVLFALMIIQQLILGKNDTAWYVTSAANRLYDALADQDLDEVWGDCKDLLCWLMCIMIGVKPWKQRDSAFSFFCDWVENVNETSMDSSTEQQVEWDGLCDPQAFVWSNTELANRVSVTLVDYRYTNPTIKIMHLEDSAGRDPNSVMISCSDRMQSMARKPSIPSIDMPDYMMQL